MKVILGPRKQLAAWISLLVLLGLPGCSYRNPASQSVSLRDRCAGHLRTTLENEHRWVKVHAAEFLTSLDYRAGVREEFSEQLALHAEEPEYRVGIFRVLAQLDRHDRPAYRRVLNKISDLFMQTSAPDRVHAIETLAKLDYQLPDFDESAALSDSIRQFASQGPTAGRAYAWWVLLNNLDPQAERQLAALLLHEESVARQTAAYVLRHQDTVTPATYKALRAALKNEPSQSLARVYLLTAVFKHRPTESPELGGLEADLLQLLQQGQPAEQYEVARLAAEMGDRWQTQLVSVLTHDQASTDVKSSVAHALCRIARRQSASMPLLDWLVVCVYGFGMIGVGLFYARRTKTAGDYLLGGRNMSSWMVGLSLFATLLSTLSYLAWPGEMIKNGPIIMLGYCSYPLVFLVVGWLLIPRLMQLQVTSAYEILENRFGISIRLLGSLLFLSLRFLWMASIIYWTTEIVLLPAAGLDQSYTPWFAMVLGLTTVIYTSLGGLRAVVVTDVMQTFILFMGAITALLLISSVLGGASAWTSNGWATHWATPRVWFDFDPNTRATLANAMLGTFSWYVCTAGSDQMAIQRYLATKDVQAARRTLAVSLSADFTVVFFLGLLGLALLAYFTANPDQMADGQTIYANADKLFPRFVVVGLPVGMSGLVIAGLLAAAMSSLSSGVNSSAAVISEDFVRRLTRNASSDGAHVRLARLTSVVVGFVVVLLSALIGHVQGNMLEVVYKVVNLFTAPLFYLFFMAIFVRQANTAGTWIGCIAGIAAAVSIAFWKDLFGVQGISFLWIIPLSLVVSVTIGYMASLLFGGSE